MRIVDYKTIVLIGGFIGRRSDELRRAVPPIAPYGPGGIERSRPELEGQGGRPQANAARTAQGRKKGVKRRIPSKVLFGSYRTAFGSRHLSTETVRFFDCGPGTSAAATTAPASSRADVRK